MIARLHSALRRYGLRGVAKNLATDVTRALGARIQRKRGQRCVERLCREGSTRQPGQSLGVIGAASIGFATRSVQPLDLGSGVPAIACVNVGSDSIDIFSRVEDQWVHQQCLQFPPWSAPIDIVMARDSTEAVVALFNNDVTETMCKVTELVACPVRTGRFFLDECEPLHTVGSHNGFRSLTRFVHNGDEYLLAPNRLSGELLFFDLFTGSVRRLALADLVGPCRPIYANALDSTGSLDLLITFVDRESLLRVRLSQDFEVLAKDELALSGLTRSNIAFGDFDGSGVPQFAIVCWGGDPMDMETAHLGSLHVFRQGGKDFELMGALEVGVNPTYVISADVEGDGRDELLVLEFGTGTRLTNRKFNGGVRVIRLRDGALVPQQFLPIPNPRSGLAYRPAGANADRVLVSAFYDDTLLELAWKRS